ncbi:MAG: diaminopimelate decarboxylase [Oscillospiraceae bacterium]
MLTSSYVGINKHGHLEMDGADCISLAEQFGTPLYVLSENSIRCSCRMFAKAMGDCFGEGRGVVAYASKALCCKELCRIVASEGLWLDVVSGGELYTASNIGFPSERIFFHGNNKTPSELEYALSEGVGYVVVDNKEELELLDVLAREKNVRQRILLRIKPGVEAHTHKYIMTGSIDSKFGFALENGEAFDAVKRAILCGSLELCGLHCHIGSQIFEIAPFQEAARIMISLMMRIKNELGTELSVLNLGGGFGMKYVDANDPVSPREILCGVALKIEETIGNSGFKSPTVVIEPGRAIAAPAGLTLYTVGATKTIEGVRSYVSVDGGITDNPRYALYGSEYTVLVANRASEARDFKATIAGRCCESGDLIQENTLLQRPRSGDILAVLATGAYNYSMSSNYNRVPKPPIVLVRDGEARVIVKGESYADVASRDV